MSPSQDRKEHVRFLVRNEERHPTALKNDNGKQSRTLTPLSADLVVPHITDIRRVETEMNKPALRVDGGLGVIGSMLDTI